VNFLTDGEADRFAADRPNYYRRLAQIKREYDPDTLFRVSHSSKPSN
jgi:Berberine and berberine like